MKIKPRFTTFCFLILTLLSCNSSQLREREIALKEKELELARKELEFSKKELQTPAASVTTNTSTLPQPVVKYMYVVIVTDEPTIYYKKSEILSGGLIKPHAKPNHFYYVSDIIQVDSYTEDKRFMEVDRFEREVRPKLAEANRRLEIEAEGRTIDVGARVVSRKSYVFETYTKASDHRSRQKGVVNE